MVRLTPAMQQYMAVKNEHPDCIVMFRMGDFYELFYEDAKTAARELDIVLTSRGKGEGKAPLAGIPCHAIEPYLAKLIKKGHKVAICEQLEDPKLAKGIVKRGLVRIITPGTLIDSVMLEEKSNNYIMSLASEKNSIGITFAEISTGEFITTVVDSIDSLKSQVSRLSPSEIIFPMSLEESNIIQSIKGNGAVLNSYDDRHFWLEKASQTLKDHFHVISLEGYGLNEKSLAVSSAGALMSYLKETQKTGLSYINAIKYYNTKKHMVLDCSTVRNLELTKNIRDNSPRGTLLSVLDFTSTVMGSRMLKKWLSEPLLEINSINDRLAAVEELSKDMLLREELKEKLSKMQDIERLISRVNYGNANCRDLIGLKNSLKTVPQIKTLLKTAQSKILSGIHSMGSQDELAAHIEKAILEEPSALVREGNMIKTGYNAELDELHNLIKKGRKWITGIEEKEKARTGIKSLKIRYNRVFGYFIEVTRSNIHLVPDDYIRKQTQANSERFITEELKKQEELVLNSEEKIAEMEYSLFTEMVAKVSEKTKDIQKIASSISELDCILNFSMIAVENNYVKPSLHNGFDLALKSARHPVIERIEKNYVPNDITIKEDSRTIILTGPNMSGKSSIMRQVALISLMAQVGSFVPAIMANLPIVDRIFTRVGASDDLYSGQSTFMVEMSETAQILNNATEKSLIILDEIGRGTSTYDGISIAWSVAEYIHSKIMAKTMFATHYHQLNKLSEEYPAVKNMNIAVSEDSEKIIFLHKLVEGGTDKSYGIQVANLAGLPKEVITKSKIIMSRLEMEDEIGSKIHKDLKLSKTEINAVKRNAEKKLKDVVQKSLLEI